jgi:hypothetical protein
MALLGLAIIFLAAAILDYRRTRDAPSPARRAWLRIAIIFGLVGVTLQFARLILRYRASGFAGHRADR